MISREEFDALRTRVSDLEGIVIEMVKTLGSAQAALKTHSDMVNGSLEKTINGMDTLATAVSTIQDQVEMLESRL